VSIAVPRDWLNIDWCVSSSHWWHTAAVPTVWMIRPDFKYSSLSAHALCRSVSHTSTILCQCFSCSIVIITSLRSASYARWQRGTAHICRAAVSHAAIDRYLLLTGPTAANLHQQFCCCAPMLGQTDGQTRDRCIDPAPHSMWAVPINCCFVLVHCAFCSLLFYLQFLVFSSFSCCLSLLQFACVLMQLVG